ncbi:glycosyltransferase family 2 protein [Flavobacterium quisquiliarum]|jgi:glycosyltransferase involved in cell wall biosynthesis|uniref:Glycosyltransferase family 2 protein n=1 Tax=Flavobacterium quisquiliarum TaxID=1834436 RepID=A0ABV8WAC9_9FLAO|nr:glycosyltransferase family 2 protein [Flavobacterium quisquiliarum]MBW1657717.1 glycosyltransferase [Flavobacterium quisquiliarum]NWL04056.1 glycosyltransferase [Flavobacterium collinsii]
MRPLLSIITINYNNADGLEKTIKSVISQIFSNFEYIVIDGDSNDNSKNIANQYLSNIDFYQSEKDTGIYNAMNKGIRVSKGEYLLFLNSGDVLNGANALSDFINHRDFEGDVIYGDYQFENGEKIFPDKLSPLFFIRTSLPHQSTLFKKDIFDKMGMYEEHYSIVADRAFFIKCFLSNQFVFKHINFSLTIYDLSGVSNNSLYKEKQELEKEKMFRENYGIYFEDYKEMIEMRRQLNEIKKQTISGIIKRISNKVKKICTIR